MFWRRLNGLFWSKHWAGRAGKGKAPEGWSLDQNCTHEKRQTGQTWSLREECPYQRPSPSAWRPVWGVSNPHWGLTRQPAASSIILSLPPQRKIQEEGYLNTQHSCGAQSLHFSAPTWHCSFLAAFCTTAAPPPSPAEGLTSPCLFLLFLR